MSSEEKDLKCNGIISRLLAQYFQLVEPSDLAIPPPDVLKDPQVQAFIYEQMFDESEIDPSPPLDYRTRVLKTVISKIEDSLTDPEEDELNEDLMNTWGALISQPPISPLDSAQKLSFIKYTTPNTGDSPPKTVITSESRGLILYSGTTGFRTWEAALHLGTYLSTPEDGQKLVCGKRVIELGAGTGFISFLIARHLGAESVLATDRDPVLVETIQRCIPRNALEPQRIGARVWEWGAEDSPLGDGNKFDVALGADLTYDADIILPLVETISDLFAHHGVKEFILAATIRHEQTFGIFLDACEKRSLRTETIPFESPPLGDQTGFFHSNAIPIRTYRVVPATV